MRHLARPIGWRWFAAALAKVLRYVPRNSLIRSASFVRSLDFACVANGLQRVFLPVVWLLAWDCAFDVLRSESQNINACPCLAINIKCHWGTTRRALESLTIGTCEKPSCLRRFSTALAKSLCLADLSTGNGSDRKSVV